MGPIRDNNEYHLQQEYQDISMVRTIETNQINLPFDTVGHVEQIVQPGTTRTNQRSVHLHTPRSSANQGTHFSGAWDASETNTKSITR